MTETGAAAVDTMVKACFDADSLPRITGPPEYGPIYELIGEITTVATGFKTCRYVGNTV